MRGLWAALRAGYYVFAYVRKVESNPLLSGQWHVSCSKPGARSNSGGGGEASSAPAVVLVYMVSKT